MNRTVQKAIKLLSLPEGPTFKELQREARLYLRTLSPKQYAALREEALVGEDGEDEDSFVENLELFRELGFTEVERRAYAPMRLNSPGVRRVIARRALLLKSLGREALPEGTTFHQVAHMEDLLIKNMSSEQILAELRR
jgi:hypothetical protein